MGMSNDPNGFNAGSQITDTRKQLIKFFILKEKRRKKKETYVQITTIMQNWKPTCAEINTSKLPLHHMGGYPRK